MIRLEPATPPQVLAAIRAPFLELGATRPARPAARWW